MPDDISLFDISCRILVLSSSISQATSFISRVQNCNGAQSSPKLTGPLEDTIAPDAREPSSDYAKVPWTIVNRYYSAAVHFAVHKIHGLSPHQLENVPALIFVWAQGESYKHHIERIFQDLIGREPEVCLAARVPPDPTITYESEGRLEDETEIDAFLSSHGFEYVHVVDDSSPGGIKEQENDAFPEGIPGLPRVLDALSTIMWPSMQAMAKGTSRTTDRQREHALLDWAQSSQDSDMTVENESQLLERTTTMRREMRELSHWLEKNEYSLEDPWKPASSATMSASPLEADFPQLISETGGEVIPGFDDNFTVFVSAPPVNFLESSGQSTPDANINSTAGLALPDLYRSLGSDFGSDDGIEDDEGLPTQEEILATSRRIFGESKVAGIELQTAGVEETMSSLDGPKFSTTAGPGPSCSVEGKESYGMARFDLSKVLGALQEMKAEIGMMDDEEERRKAAAKVALGLVYGLESE